jgi:hypothetical protein
MFNIPSFFGFRSGASGGGFDSDYQAVLNYAATIPGCILPTAGQQIKQNQLVLDLKLAGAWSKLDTFAVFATDAVSSLSFSIFALICWKRLITMTAIDSPTFTSNVGYRSNGTSSYINMNFNASTFGGNYTQNDACFGCNVATITNGGQASVMNTSLSRSLMRGSANAFNGINSTFIQANSVAFADADNTRIHDRSSAANYVRIGNSTIKETVGQSSSGLPTTMWALRDNFAWSPSNLNFRFAFAGSSLSSVRVLFQSSLSTYLTSL